MSTQDERRFYRRLRPQALEMGLRISRLENAVESGWPDVLVRSAGGKHVWLELKIAHGREAKIRVRPEQITWAEDHASLGGSVFALALDELNPKEFWLIRPKDLRERSVTGCLGAEKFYVRDFRKVMRWALGEVRDLQSKDPTHSQSGSTLGQASGRRIVRRTLLSGVRESGLSNSRHNRRPHRAEVAWWVA